MLSTTAEYALRIMVVLAEDDGRPTTSEIIASRTEVPSDYSVKVLQMLARAGLVRAQRGRGGGFRIQCDPGQTSLLEIVNAIERKERPSRRSAPIAVQVVEFDALRRRVEEITHLLRDSLASTTLASIVPERRAAHPTVPGARPGSPEGRLRA